MLNEIMFEVFDKVLDKNLFRVDCFLSKVKGRRMLTITTNYLIKILFKKLRTLYWKMIFLVTMILCLMLI